MRECPRCGGEMVEEPNSATWFCPKDWTVTVPFEWTLNRDSAI